MRSKFLAAIRRRAVCSKRHSIRDAASATGISRCSVWPRTSARLSSRSERSWTQLARAGLLNGHRAASRRARRRSSDPPTSCALCARRSSDWPRRISRSCWRANPGWGKELVARQIHDVSRRRNGPFVAINCAALVETLLEAELFGIEERTATGVRGRRGKFEHADGGTLFLDEVSDLSVSAQAKLLRAIQDLTVQRVGGQATRRVDVRIIAATNRSLAELVERQLFRPDLFYRLSGVDIRVPTLRERRPDILELARYFLERHRVGRRLKLTPAAADAMVTYNWPGNVRELERMMERAVTLAESDVIDLDDLPPAVRGAYSTALGPSLKRQRHTPHLGLPLRPARRGTLRRQQRAASRALGISYHTLKAYMRSPFYESVGDGNPAAPIDRDGREGQDGQNDQGGGDRRPAGGGSGIRRRRIGRLKLRRVGPHNAGRLRRNRWTRRGSFGTAVRSRAHPTNG